MDLLRDFVGVPNPTPFNGKASTRAWTVQHATSQRMSGAPRKVHEALCGNE